MFVDQNIMYHVVFLIVPKAILTFIVAYLFFVKLSSVVFPQKYAGNGLEKIVSNILYMLVFVEIVVPALILMKVFNMAFFFVVIFLSKLLFMKIIDRRFDVSVYLIDKFNKTIAKFLDVVDNWREEWNYVIKFSIKRLKYRLYKLNNFSFLFKIIFFLVFSFSIYTIACKNFYSLSFALPDVAQFVEWVKNLDMNILYSDKKAFGADFYGLSVFVFLLYKLSNIDLILLFNIYPLLLVAFLLLIIYFVIKMMTFNRYVALMTVLIFSTLLIGSPINHYIITASKTVDDPVIINIFDLIKIYDLNSFHILRASDYATRPISRYTAGLPYEFASAFFLINLYYLIQIFRKFKKKYLLNYTLSLTLIFIFHGGGAIVLLFPSLLIFVNALLYKKVTWSVFQKGLVAVLVSVILGNLWVFSFFKYGLPKSFGAAAPFLDYLFHTKHVTDYIKAGVNAVSILDVTYFHLFLFILLIVAFLITFFLKRKFVCSSFLLITLGTFFVFFAANLGFGNIVRIYRSAEYFMLGMTILTGFYLWFIFSILRKFEPILLSLFLFIDVVFIPKYCSTNYFWKSVDHIQYNTVAYYTYKIIKENRVLTWTIVSYVQEYSKILGLGYMINTNEFILDYNPKEKYLKVPTNKVYIFVEDLPHSYKGSFEWYYRWRNELSLKLKEWVSIYSLYHDNIKVYAKAANLTIYEIDNTDYMNYLLSQRQSRQ